MRKIIFTVIFTCLPLILFSQDLVEKIEIIGNERVSRETVLYYLSSREGDYYNQELFKRDFRVLWSTGFFSKIKIIEDVGISGKIIKIEVAENPVIAEIVYKTGKKIKEDDIVNKLKENDEYILPYSYYSPHKIQKVKKTIEDLLLEKGLQAGKVDAKVNKKGKNELEVLFDINEGPKIRVAEVIFEGKTKLPESVLRGAMKENKKHGLISWISGKDSFKKNKLAEDANKIKEKLKEQGYMEATVGEPRIEEVTKRSIFFRKQKMVRIIVPVDPGYLYMTGDVKIEGNKITNTKALRKLIKLKEGAVYNTKVREKSVEEIGKVYQNVGYVYARVFPVENLDPKRKRVNVTFNIVEGEMAFLNRLEIRGNTYTKDKVIRRELLIREGDPFRFALFQDSMLRMKQLGLVELEKEPDIKPDPNDPTKLNAVMHVKELQRNNIQFTAGYSGYEGTFIALSYSTVNFLGAGENVELVFQHGKRVKNYSFGFTEPYIFDYPMRVGFKLFKSYIYYPYLYERNTKGINLTLGARLKGYWQTSLTYGYEFVNIGLPEGEEGFIYDPVYYSMFGLGNYNVSSITAILFRSTIDSPLTPTRGTKYLASCRFAGSFLGGEISLIKPGFEWAFYRPIVRNHVIGLHLNFEFMKPIGDTDIPFWERFYLGGERSIRGYDFYTIGPRSEQGTNIGGEKSLYFNLEYIIPAGGPLYAILFYDVGNAYAPDQKISLRDLYSSAGLELRIFVPALRVPFRLIFAYNNRRIRDTDSNFAFRFAVGTTF